MKRKAIAPNICKILETVLDRIELQNLPKEAFNKLLMRKIVYKGFLYWVKAYTPENLNVLAPLDKYMMNRLNNRAPEL